VHLGLKAESGSGHRDRRQAAGEEAVAPDYVDAMLEREQLVSTYRRIHRRAPRHHRRQGDVKRTGIVICQYRPVAFRQAPMR
jgi:PTS system mannitol-specific IIC component